MDPLQLKALNALEPFVALSKSATSPGAACELITQATSAPDTYVFAELLSTPSIRSLRTGGPSFTPHLRLLEIFAWGTYSDLTNESTLPTLTPPQLHKLRLLSLLPLCSSPAHQPPTYRYLVQSLDLPCADALERLLRDASNVGLLAFRLSPRSQLVHISAIAPLRDVAPGAVLPMLAALDDWDSRCTAVLSDLEARVGETTRRALERQRRHTTTREAVEKALLPPQKAGLAVRGTAGANKGSGKRAAGSDLDAELGPGGAAGDDDEEVGGEAYEMEVDEGNGAEGAAKESVHGGRGLRKNARARSGKTRGGKRGG